MILRGPSRTTVTHVSILTLAVAVSLLVLVLPALVTGPPLPPQPIREPLCKRVPAVQILLPGYCECGPPPGVAGGHEVPARAPAHPPGQRSACVWVEVTITVPLLWSTATSCGPRAAG